MTTTPPLRRAVWAQLGEPAIVAEFAGAGFDWICLDGQHGLFDRERIAASMLRRAPEWAPVAVRVPKLDAAEIGFALDVGADIVIVPLVDSAADAGRAVDAVRYPPLGRRSWGPLASGAPDPATANARVRLWVMIETREGLAALDEILAVPGVDGIFIGPFDLSLALGLTLDELLDDTSQASALDRVRTACEAAGVDLGVFGGSPPVAGRLIARGFRSVVVATDAAVMAAGSAAVLGADAPAARGSTY